MLFEAGFNADAAVGTLAGETSPTLSSAKDELWQNIDATLEAQLRDSNPALVEKVHGDLSQRMLNEQGRMMQSLDARSQAVSGKLGEAIGAVETAEQLSASDTAKARSIQKKASERDSRLAKDGGDAGTLVGIVALPGFASGRRLPGPSPPTARLM